MKFKSSDRYKSLGKIVNNTAWLLSDKILRAGVGVFITAWFARSLGPEQLGIYNYAFAFVALLLPLVTLGIDEILIRDVVREPQSRDEILGSACALKLLGGLTLCTIVITAAWIIHPTDALTHFLVVIFSLGTLLKAFDVVDLWFQAQVKSQHFVLPRLLSFLVFTGLRIFVLKTENPMRGFAVLWAGEYLIGSLASGLRYSQRVDHPFKWKISLDRMRRLFRQGLPLLLSTIMVSLYMRLDQVLLKWLTSNHDVGIYSGAVKLVEAVYFVPMVITASLFPSVVKSKQLHPREYQDRIQSFFDLLIWLSIAFALGTSTLAPTITRLLLGPAFEGAASILSLYGWMALSIFFMLARLKWLAVEEKLSASLHVESLTVALNLGSNLFLIPKLGARGAAISALLSSLGANLLVASYSAPIRTSLLMYSRSLLLPLRLGKQLRSKRVSK